MDKVLIEILKMMPTWFNHAAAIVILIGMISIVWWITSGAKKFSNAINKETRLLEMQDELDKLRELSKENYETSLQSITTISNVELYIRELNELRSKHSKNENDIINLIERVIESLSQDIKKHAGARHRCVFWIGGGNNDEYLTPVATSTGFPDNYLSIRRLNVNNSIAGRSFRKKELINREDVKIDEDWQEYDNSLGSYVSLICIPISEWGVLTIDGTEMMNKNDEKIGVLYASVIEGLINELFDYISTEEEVAI